MNGHDHGDALEMRNKIPFYTVNSSAYIWAGSVITDSEELRAKYGHMNGILPYKNAFHVLVEINNNEIAIHGMDGEYLSVTPEDIGLSDYCWNGVSIRPKTSSYLIKL